MGLWSPLHCKLKKGIKSYSEIENMAMSCDTNKNYTQVSNAHAEKTKQKANYLTEHAIKNEHVMVLQMKQVYLLANVRRQNVLGW